MYGLYLDPQTNHKINPQKFRFKPNIKKRFIKLWEVSH